MPYGVKVSSDYCGKISRYLDTDKKRFSGMKSHDCHVMMTQILPVALRGTMDKHVRDTLIGLCNFFDVISRKSISVKQLRRLQEEIVVILNELEMYFPPVFFDVMVHLCVHIVDDIIDLGLSFLHNMMSFERMNGIIKGFVRNMSRPDGSIVQGYLTQECISLCENFYMAQTSLLVLVLVCPLTSTMGGSKEKVTATVAGNCTWHTQIDAATLTEQTW